jgi:hypothetical protein
MIYLLTAIGWSPDGSTHLRTNNTQNNTNNKRTTQIQTNVEECGSCPVFASFTLAFALQLRKKHGNTSDRLRKTSVKVYYVDPSNNTTVILKVNRMKGKVQNQTSVTVMSSVHSMQNHIIWKILFGRSTLHNTSEHPNPTQYMINPYLPNVENRVSS